MELDCVFCKDKFHDIAPLLASLADVRQQENNRAYRKKVAASGKIALFPNSQLEPNRANRLP